jgi:hypothetical protein
MKWIALQDILMENIAQKTNSNVTIIFVFDKMTCVTERMIVMTDRMKKKSFAETFLVTNCLNSNAATSNAFQISLFVTVKMIVVMEQMRIT